MGQDQPLCLTSLARWRLAIIATSDPFWLWGEEEEEALGSAVSYAEKMKIWIKRSLEGVKALLSHPSMPSFDDSSVSFYWRERAQFSVKRWSRVLDTSTSSLVFPLFPCVFWWWGENNTAARRNYVQICSPSPCSEFMHHSPVLSIRREGSVSWSQKT